MPTLNLTDAAVKRIKAPTDAARMEYWDTTTLDGKPTGLGLRVSQTGARSWVTIVRALKAGNWVQQRVTLGRYPAMTLAAARKAAVEARIRAARGEDPADVPRQQHQELVDNSCNTFAKVRDDFLTKYRGRQNRHPAPRTLAEIKRVLTSELFNGWKDRPLVEVTRRNVLDVLDVLVDRGAEVMANRTLAYLSMLFAWALDRNIIKADPTDSIKKPGAETSRARVLSPLELRTIWLSTETGQGDLFEGIVKILILSGQRRNEVAGMRWSEINGEIWHLPGERTKNHLPHLVPLSAPVLAILAKRRNEQQALGLNVDLVFTSYNPDFKRYKHSATPRHFSGWSKSKSRLDERAMIESWTLHDLRRTMATLMAEKLQITPHIIEAIINHVSGTKAGVAGTYNRALYLDERKKTLNTWADYVLRIIHCEDADLLINQYSLRSQELPNETR